MIEELQINVENLKRRSLYNIDDVDQNEDQDDNQEESKHQIINDKLNF